MTERIASAIAVSALLIASPSTAVAQGGSMAGMPGMPGMDMSKHIMIPKGANITVADVEFMQGFFPELDVGLVILTNSTNGAFFNEVRGRSTGRS